MCTENKIPEKPFDFFFVFSFLQVALSLEDHSSEVQVVKHLLHILPPDLPGPSPPRGQARRAPSFESTLSRALKFTTHGECVEGYQVRNMVQVSLFTEIPQP